MLSIIKRVPWKMCLANSALRASVNKSTAIKASIEDALNKPTSKIFTEDLKTLLYTTKSDADLDLLIKAVQKYKAQDSLSTSIFKFEAPIMRLIYSMNKTDKGLELFMVEDKDHQNILLDSMTASMMLINKFLEDKRYDAIIPIYEKLKTKYPSIDLRTRFLIMEGLIEKNDAEALKVAKDIELVSKDDPYYDLVAKKAFLLAINQNDNSYAYELTDNMKKSTPIIVNNLKIIALCRLGRLDEAHSIAESSISIKTTQDQSFFPETIEELKKAYESITDNEELKQRFANIVEKGTGRIFARSLRKIVLKPFIFKGMKNKLNSNSPNRFSQRDNANDRPVPSYQSRTSRNNSYDGEDARDYQSRGNRGDEDRSVNRRNYRNDSFDDSNRSSNYNNTRGFDRDQNRHGGRNLGRYADEDNLNRERDSGRRERVQHEDEDNLYRGRDSGRRERVQHEDEDNLYRGRDSGRRERVQYEDEDNLNRGRDSGRRERVRFEDDSDEIDIRRKPRTRN